MYIRFLIFFLHNLLGPFITSGHSIHIIGSKNQHQCEKVAAIDRVLFNRIQSKDRARHHDYRKDVGEKQRQPRVNAKDQTKAVLYQVFGNNGSSKQKLKLVKVNDSRKLVIETHAHTVTIK